MVYFEANLDHVAYKMWKAPKRDTFLLFVIARLVVLGRTIPGAFRGVNGTHSIHLFSALRRRRFGIGGGGRRWWWW